MMSPVPRTSSKQLDNIPNMNRNKMMTGVYSLLNFIIDHLPETVYLYWQRMVS